MTKVYAVVAALLLAAFAGWWGGGRQGAQKALQAENERRSMATQLATANASLRAAKEAWDRERAVLEERARVRITQAQRAKTQIKELDHAVQTAPRWAAEPVPDSVWDAVTGTGASAPQDSR